MFDQEVSPTDVGGLVLQPGAWTDHPDYEYAGHTEMVPGMPRSPVSGIAPDSSHSHRLPLFLSSLAEGGRNSGEEMLYRALKAGLAEQFLAKVAVPPSESFGAVRLTNFMDGHNGVYRWGYQTIGEGSGYGPYELSGTFNLGWWAFLGDTRVRDLYVTQVSKFPLPEAVIDTYLGPGRNSLREQNLRITSPECYRNGMRELLVRLATWL